MLNELGVPCLEAAEPLRCNTSAKQPQEKAKCGTTFTARGEKITTERFFAN
jgi:hypothetical protein